MKNYLLLIFLLIIWVNLQAQNDEKKRVTQEFELELSVETTYYPTEGQFTSQHSFFPSFAVTPEYALSWNNGYESLKFKGFFRLDLDKKRTHWDIRELYYQKAQNNWELNIGLKKVFWGVTESTHLVDIINQTDQVESFDGEEKLGQPMANFTLTSDRFGAFDFYYLPYHRKRVFAGEKGRLRFGTVIDGTDIDYENSNEEWQPSFAFRWSHYFGIVDIGITQYYGAGREPLFTFNPDGDFSIFYPIIYQSGLDLQITSGAFLWKIESIYRYADLQDFFASAVGLEYTFSNLNGKGLDIGVLTEFLYDSRDELTLSSADNDLFYGSRIAFNGVNDTAVLIGGLTDIKTGSSILSLEASRRIGDSWTINIETRLFTYVDNREIILPNFKDDSFIKIKASKYF